MKVPELPKSKCDRCARWFSSMSAFDSHQTVRYRNAGSLLACKIPVECGLVAYPGGIWDWPAGKLFRKMRSHVDDAAVLDRLSGAGYWELHAAFKFAKHGPLAVMYRDIVLAINGKQNEFTRARVIHAACRQMGMLDA
jgi:hypothetical protein